MNPLENQPLTCYNLSMRVFVPVGIIILAMVIMFSLQLVPGVFAIFHHYALGKYSKKRASILSLFFILGAEVVSACLFMSCFYFAYLLFFGFDHPETSFIAYILAGVIIALAIMSFFFYYRRGPGTQLFIPRSFAVALRRYARSASSRSDAFMLGALSGVCELVFTFPLYIITSIEIMEMSISHLSNNVLTVLYIIAPIVPLVLIAYRYHSGRNLADIQRSRVKDKHFTRFIMSLSYLIIAILIICFRIQ